MHLFFLKPLVIFFAITTALGLKTSGQCVNIDSLKKKTDITLFKQLTTGINTNNLPKRKMTCDSKDTTVYTCIIVTRHADVLKKKGYDIQTSTPNFATARLKRKEIYRLIKRKDVDKIKSSDRLSPSEFKMQ